MKSNKQRLGHYSSDDKPFTFRKAQYDEGLWQYTLLQKRGGLTYMSQFCIEESTLDTNRKGVAERLRLARNDVRG